MKLWVRAELLRLTNIRASQNRKMGDPGPEGSIGKMASAELNKETYELCIELLGAEGCKTNGFDNFDKIAFWKTPQAEGGKYVPYSRWTQDYIAIMGGR